MKQPLHLIYIPGLGDNMVKGQQYAVNTWRFWGVEAELFQMHWADNEPWQSKFERLLGRIDKLAVSGKAVALVGASAGASAAINAYAARKDKIVGVVCIAGKVNRPETIGERYRLQNPSFVASAYECQKALATLKNPNRKRILSRFALLDETVYKADSRIPGAHNRLVPTFGHAPTIATQIILGAPSFIHFLKQQTRIIK